MKHREKALLLHKLGLEKLSQKILTKGDNKKKLLMAMDYKYATQDEIDEFNTEIRVEGKRLAFKDIKDYEKLPPDSVLEDLKEAQEKGCFDSFQIAYIEKVKDPILFGKITDFSYLYFYISQWGDDVKIEDIIKWD